MQWKAKMSLSSCQQVAESHCATSFQHDALLLVSIVISPLLSLMQDQVQLLTKLGIESAFLNSAQDYKMGQKDITTLLFEATDHGGIKLLYIFMHSNMMNLNRVSLVCCVPC